MTKYLELEIVCSFFCFVDFLAYVDLDPEVVGTQQSPPPPNSQPQKQKKVKVPLNSNDRLFSEVRDLNFTVLLPLLNAKAKEIEQYYKVFFIYTYH